MGFEPTQAKRMGSAVNRFNFSATLPNRSLFNDKLNRNKKKWSKDALLQIEFCLLKTKHPSNQTFNRSKIDLRSVYLKGNDELSTLVLEQD